jgi:hypothetical protein
MHAKTTLGIYASRHPKQRTERADARESLAAMRTQRYLELSLLVLVLVPLPSLLLSLLLLAMQRRFHCNVILPSIRHASRWPHADQLRITL